MIIDINLWILSNQEKIFKYYLNVEVTNKLILSPFRVDHKPTCGFYYGKTGRLYLHDFRTEEHIDAIEAVKKKFKINYPDALAKILKDSENISSVSNNKVNKTKNITWIPSNEKSDYFEKFHIPDSLLTSYNVFKAKAVFNDELIWAKWDKNNPIFIYLQPSKRFRVYRPLANDNKKWFGNLTNNDIFGLYNIPNKGQILFITSSLKDVMVLKVLGYNSIALGGEGYGAGKKGSETRELLAQLLENLKHRYSRIIFFMDGDKAGIDFNRRLSNIYNLEHVYLENTEKDISDYVKRYGVVRGKRKLKKLLKKYAKRFDANCSNINSGNNISINNNYSEGLEYEVPY